MNKIKPIAKEIVDQYFQSEGQDLSKLIAAHLYKLRTNEGIEIPTDPVVFYVNAEVHNEKVRRETPIGTSPNELNIRFDVADPKKVRGFITFLENQQMDEEEAVLDGLDAPSVDEPSLEDMLASMSTPKKMHTLDQLEKQAMEDLELFGKFANEYVNYLLSLPDDEYMIKAHRFALKEADAMDDSLIINHVQEVFEEKTGSSLILNDYTVDPVDFDDKTAAFWDLEADVNAPKVVRNKQALAAATGIITIPALLTASGFLGKLKRQGIRAGRSIARTEAFRDRIKG